MRATLLYLFFWQSWLSPSIDQSWLSMIRSSVWRVSCRNQSSWLLQNGTRRAYSSAVPTIAPATRRKLLRPRNLFGATVVGLLVGYGIDREVNASVLQRNIRTAIAGASIAIDYKLNFDPKNPEPLHERCAARLLDCCEKNAGLYVKVSWPWLSGVSIIYSSSWLALI